MRRLIARLDPFVVIGFIAVFIAGFTASMMLLFPNAPTLSTAVGMVEAPFEAAERVFIPTPTHVFGKDHLRILLVGLDYDYDKLDQETSKSSRSDVIMALYADFKSHRIAELSIPRDMLAVMPNGKRAKINQAQAEGGITESQAVIARWLGIPPFDRYVVLRINTAKDIIDAVGGIELDVKNSNALKGVGPNGPVDYDDNWGHFHLHLKPGLQHLDGDHAVSYGRFRHDWCSDPCRIMRQQEVIRAVVDKIQHNGFNTLTHVQRLLSVIRKDIQTDFTFQEEIVSVLAFSHLTSADVRTAQVPFASSVYLPEYGDAIVPDTRVRRKLVDAMLFAPDELMANAGPAIASVSNGIRVRIENGTNIPEVAQRVAASLRRQGFTVTGIAQADNPVVALSLIESLPENTSALNHVHRALEPSIPNARTWNQSDTVDDASDVTVILGRDAVSVVP